MLFFSSAMVFALRLIHISSFFIQSQNILHKRLVQYYYHPMNVRVRALLGSATCFMPDTIELDFSTMKTIEGCGPLNEETRRGFFMHSLYVLSEPGLPLGLLDTAIVARRDEDFRNAAARKHLPIAQKESFRWVQGYSRT